MCIFLGEPTSAPLLASRGSLQRARSSASASARRSPNREDILHPRGKRRGTEQGRTLGDKTFARTHTTDRDRIKWARLSSCATVRRDRGGSRPGPGLVSTNENCPLPLSLLRDKRARDLFQLLQCFFFISFRRNGKLFLKFCLRERVLLSFGEIISLRIFL